MFSEENTLIMNEHELKVKSAAFIILHSILNKQKKTKRNDRRWWSTHLSKQREAGSHLMDHLQFDKSTGQYLKIL